MANSSTNLDQVTAQQSQKEVTVNGLFDAGSPGTAFGRRQSTSGGLVWGYFGGTMNIDGIPTATANGTISLVASATNYIELSPAGAVSANTTAFTPGRIPLYTAVCGTATITRYTDHRNFATPDILGYLYKSVAGGSNVTLSAYESICQVIDLYGALTANITVYCPNRPWRYKVKNGTSGAYEITFSTIGGSGVKVPQGDSYTLVSDGSNILFESSSGLLNLLSKSVAGGVDVTLNANEYSANILEFTGALTANINVIVPVTAKQWTVFNNTTGAFTLTVKTPAGTGIAIGQTKRAIVYADGTNVVRATADV